MMLQQLAIYAVLGLALDAAGQDYTQPLYWCVLALVILSNYLSRREGYEDATIIAETVWTESKKFLEDAIKAREAAEAMLIKQSDSIDRIINNIEDKA